MKVLTVKNPWAYLIVYGGRDGHKDIENRTWKTDYRGPLLIHCSRYMDAYAPRDIFLLGIRWEDYNGHIIGRADLEDCVRDSESEWAEDGLWHWVLKDPRPCKPIPIKGSLGLWDYNGLYHEENR